MQIPNSVLHAATGIPESTFTEFKKYPLVIAPGTGGEACLAKCNITFQAVRSPPPCAALCASRAATDRCLPPMRRGGCRGRPRQAAMHLRNCANRTDVFMSLTAALSYLRPHYR